MSQGRCKWIGGSGKRYEYSIFRLPCRLEPGQLGNYIFARLDSQGRWVPVYIGEGDLAEAISFRNPMWEMIEIRGATHFHAHTRPDELRRLDEQEDLLARYLNAYLPHGCNTPKPSDDQGVEIAVEDLAAFEKAEEPQDDRLQLSSSGTGLTDLRPDSESGHDSTIY